MNKFLTTWTMRKVLTIGFSALLLAAGIFGIVWEPEQRERGSLVLGNETAPLVITELADFT